MPNNRFLIRSSTAALIAALASLSALPTRVQAQAVTDRTVSEVRSQQNGSCTTLTINFNIRVQVLSAFPMTGRELHIRILPLDGGAANLGRESLSLPNEVRDLRSIEYEGNNAAGPTLSLLFTRDMKFVVAPGEQPQSVVIQVLDPTAAGDCASANASANASPAKPVDTAEASRLVAAAEQAIKDGTLDRAAELLAAVAEMPDSDPTARANELLGLVYERKGQTAQARFQYEEFLRRFPQAEGADRVRQRLAALGTADEGQVAAPQQLRPATGSAASADAWKWNIRGSVSQFYFRDEGRTSSLTTSSTLGTEIDNSVNVNQLLSTGDITISGGDNRRQIQMRAAGSYTKNFGTSRSIISINEGSEVRTYSSRPGGAIEALTALYLDYADSDINSSLRVGRQTRNSSGVLGRFDGALVGWQAKPKLRFNIVGGFPVLSSRQTWVLKERPFYGVSVDLGNKRSPIQTTFYWFDERARGGFVDRRSAGIEARILRKNFNAYGIFDYDVKFNTVNLGLLTLNYNFPDGSNLALTGDYRKSPLLTTTNALIGQYDTINNRPFDDLRGLQPFFTDAEIYQLARDRTLTAKTLTATYSRPLTKKLQLSTDFSMTNTGGTPGTAATAGTPEVGALPAVGTEYFYGAQLIGTDLFMTNDIYILSGRFADTATTRIYTLDVNARVPVTTKFRISPRLRYGYRDGKITDATPVPGNFRQLQPTLRLNYYPVRHSEIEVEFGGNFSTRKEYIGSSLSTTKERGWVLTAGYRLDF